jgi:hypothetical protein
MEIPDIVFENNSRSFSTWVQISNTVEVIVPIMYLGNDNNSISIDWNTQETKFEFTVSNESVVDKYTSGVYDVSELVHVAWIMDGTVWNIYINGELIENSVHLYPNSTQYITRKIAKSHDDSVILNGVVKDFRIYNRILTKEDIINIYDKTEFAPIGDGSGANSIVNISDENKLLDNSEYRSSENTEGGKLVKVLEASFVNLFRNELWAYKEVDKSHNLTLPILNYFEKDFSCFTFFVSPNHFQGNWYGGSGGGVPRGGSRILYLENVKKDESDPSITILIYALNALDSLHTIHIKGNQSAYTKNGVSYPAKTFFDFVWDFSNIWDKNQYNHWVFKFRKNKVYNNGTFLIYINKVIVFEQDFDDYLENVEYTGSMSTAYSVYPFSLYDLRFYSVDLPNKFIESMYDSVINSNLRRNGMHPWYGYVPYSYFTVPKNFIGNVNWKFYQPPKTGNHFPLNLIGFPMSGQTGTSLSFDLILPSAAETTSGTIYEHQALGGRQGTTVQNPKWYLDWNATTQSFEINQVNAQNRLMYVGYGTPGWSFSIPGPYINTKKHIVITVPNPYNNNSMTPYKIYCDNVLIKTHNWYYLQGGQRQRIGIARALYHNPEVLVLDEATSALDNQTESEVISSIELVARRCTVLVIAHRLSTIMRCDKIYEFNKGNIIASGSYDELRKSSSSFRRLAMLEGNLMS